MANPDPVHAVQWPLSVHLETIDAMVNFEIHNHPVYTGVEVQSFDDEAHGTGVLVLMCRADNGKVDVYQQPGLTIDRSGYGIAAGLGDWFTVDISPAVLEVSDSGVHVDIKFDDKIGRAIEIQVDDRNGKRRCTAEFLAPVGAEIEHPTELMLVWMRRFDLVRQTGIDPVVRIDGESIRIGRLPGRWMHRRHLIKVASDLWIVSVNPDESKGTLDAHGPGEANAQLHLSPPPPAPGMLKPGEVLTGKWSVSIGDHADVVSGTWKCAGTPVVALTFAVTRGWQPRQLPLFMRVVTTVLPMFRRWPTTYMWEARADVRDGYKVEATWRRTVHKKNLYTKVTS
ncbi:hypothetical protein IEU95_10080 [Hoyosella rhizosphaerae]|nr:hypothetical protein [Hoyosella rhizosphaerae]MBN4927182.1 hypothetical protein [Hoyosella rhizosphaerae]